MLRKTLPLVLLSFLAFTGVPFADQCGLDNPDLTCGMDCSQISPKKCDVEAAAARACSDFSYQGGGSGCVSTSNHPDCTCSPGF